MEVTQFSCLMAYQSNESLLAWAREAAADCPGQLLHAAALNRAVTCTGVPLGYVNELRRAKHRAQTLLLQHGQKELPNNQTPGSTVVQNLSGWQAPVKGTKARPLNA